jgi:hypothetical protein
MVEIRDQGGHTIGCRPCLEQRDACRVRSFARLPAGDRDPETDDALDGLLVVHRIAASPDEVEIFDQFVDRPD